MTPEHDRWAQIVYVHPNLMVDPPRLAAFDKWQAESVEFGASRDGYVLTGPVNRVGEPEPLWWVDLPGDGPDEPSGRYVTKPQAVDYGVRDDAPPSVLLLRYQAPIEPRRSS